MSFATEPYVDPFARYTDPTEAGEGPASSASKGLHYWSLIRLQRWNVACRLLSFAFTLGGFFSIFFANGEGTGSYKNWDATYSTFSSFQFLLYANGVAALYTFTISALGVVMVLHTKIRASPAFMRTAILAVNLTACVFLLLAFSAGTATEAISRDGWKFSQDGYTATQAWKLCDYYSSFCSIIELGLAFTGLAFLALAASSGIEAYCNTLD